MFAFRLTLLATVPLLFTLLPAMADDKADEKVAALKKQKSVAQATVTSSKLKMGTGETADLIVYAPYSNEKVQAMAMQIQKTYTTAAKVLKQQGDDAPFVGKLTVFVFTDPKDYKSFALMGQKRSVKPKETHDYQLRGETPTITLVTSQTGKPTDAIVTMDAAKYVAAALLNAKAGTTMENGTLPPWLEEGFGSAAYLRTEGNATKLSAYRAKVRTLNTRTSGEAIQTKYLWSGTSSPEVDSLTTSFVEFLAYGPMADKFPSLLSAFKPSEGNDSPTTESVLSSLEWKMPEVEASWRKWVVATR